MRWTRSVIGMAGVLVLVGSLAWAGDPVPMFGDVIDTILAFRPDPASAIRGTAIPIGRGAFKIAENESPRPQNRLFLHFNYYKDVPAGGTLQQLYREVIGFEKTLLGGDASAGLRLPFVQFQDAQSSSVVDDLSLLFKYAPLTDRETGSVLSTGLVVTVPTGATGTLAFLKDGRVEKGRAALFQPFIGYLWNKGDFFVHGFESLMVATDSRAVTILFTDLGLGYRFLHGDRGRLVTGITPTVELHVNTPLNHRSGAFSYRDSVNFTGGVHVALKERYLFGVAVGTPVAGARLFDREVIAYVNWRF